MTSTRLNTVKSLLKLNLEITTASKDTLLENLITMAETAIEKEGITLDTSTVDHQMLIVMYASWLYNKRLGEEQAMPRMLRWQLNQHLLAEKMSDET